MTIADCELVRKMRTRADADNLPPAHELRELAQAFEEGVKGFYATPQTCDAKSFLGRWARARRAWCDYTGEPLI